MIEATGLQRIYNVIVFAVATLHVVVIFCFLLLLHLLAKSSAPAARADLAIAFETPPIPPFVHLDQIDIFFASSWSDRYYYLFCMKQSTETSGYPQAPRIPSSSPITWWSRTYLHKLSVFFINSLVLLRCCRSLIKVKFSIDQFRPALGSCCCSVDCHHAQKTSKLPQILSTLTAFY